MTDAETLRNMKKGDKININNQILKIKSIEDFDDEVNDGWILINLDEEYKLVVDNTKIDFFRIMEMGAGDEFLENIKIEKIEEVKEEE